jgi:dTDP-4-dehydrorhamnose reductase
MKLAITGAAGLLGGHLVAHAQALGVFDEVRPLDLPDGDLTDPAVPPRLLGGVDVVLHAAAWTDVDGAESQEAAAHRVNAVASANVADACRVGGARLIAVSTDYVFSGLNADGSRRAAPYEPDEEPDPRTAYGRTKLAGEREVLARCERSQIVRTAWVYDGERGFPATMKRLAAERETVSVVDDQVGSPTFAGDLAAALLHLVQHPQVTARRLHATNAGVTTWFGLAQETFRLLGDDPARVLPTTSDQFRRPAERPAFSVLSPRVWVESGLPPLRAWQDGLRDALTGVSRAIAGVS